MPMIYQEDSHEFMNRHGGQKKAVRVGSQLIFPTGAVMSDDGSWYEPPEDALELLKMKRNYAEGMLAKSKAYFAEIRDYINTSAQWNAMGAGPPPDPAALADLKEAKSQILRWRVHVAFAKENLMRHPAMANYKAAYLAEQAENAASIRRETQRITAETMDDTDDFGPDDGGDM